MWKGPWDASSDNPSVASAFIRVAQASRDDVNGDTGELLGGQ